VWGFPCESKSSPAHYSKHPLSNDRGCFFMAGKKKTVENNENRAGFRLKTQLLIK